MAAFADGVSGSRRAIFFTRGTLPADQLAGAIRISSYRSGVSTYVWYMNRSHTRPVLR